MSRRLKQVCMRPKDFLSLLTEGKFDVTISRGIPERTSLYSVNYDIHQDVVNIVVFSEHFPDIPSMLSVPYLEIEYTWDNKNEELDCLIP